MALLAGEYVSVDLEGEGDVGVAEAFADDSGVDSGCEELGGVGVAESVKGDVRDGERADEVGEASADVVGVVGSAGGCGEDVVVVVPCVSGEGALGALVGVVLAEDGGGFAVEVDDSSAAA